MALPSLMQARLQQCGVLRRQCRAACTVGVSAARCQQYMRGSAVTFAVGAAHMLVRALHLHRVLTTVTIVLIVGSLRFMHAMIGCWSCAPCCACPYGRVILGHRGAVRQEPWWGAHT
jgi:hypothetical protein